MPAPLAVHAHARRTLPNQGPPCTCNPVPIRGAGSARPAPRTASGHTARDSAAGTQRTAGIRRAQRRPPAPATTTSAARAPCDSCTRSGTARSAARCPHAVPAQTACTASWPRRPSTQSAGCTTRARHGHPCCGSRHPSSPIPLGIFLLARFRLGVPLTDYPYRKREDVGSTPRVVVGVTLLVRPLEVVGAAWSERVAVDLQLIRFRELLRRIGVPPYRILDCAPPLARLSLNATRP